KDVVAIPVQALVLQDLADRIAEEEKAEKEAAAGSATPAHKTARSERDVEGVFKLKDGKASFVPVKTGLQGELLIEVLEGVAAGDRIITGPFRVLRTLHDGDRVRPEKPADKKGKGPG